MALSQRRARLVKRLRSRRSRVREGLVLVEGVRAAATALDAGCEVRFAVVSDRLRASAEGDALAARLAAYDTTEIADDELAELADTEHPQGVLLVCDEPDSGGIAGERLLVIDALQDPGNLGTLVRSAAAFGIDGVVCLDGTVDPWGAKSVRAAAGLSFSIAVVAATVEEVLAYCEEEEVPLYVADGAGDPVGRYAGAERFAIVVGNEGAGVRTFLRERAEARVAVPMSGPAESLNAGVAGSILMHVLTGGGAVV